MKTFFDQDEILDFLRKHKDSLIADEIISRTTINPEYSEINSFQDMLHHIYKMGCTHGKLEGRSEMMLEIMDFFECKS